MAVYLNRILRGFGLGGFYSTRTLGTFGADLGAVACFFAEPWLRPEPSLTEPSRLLLDGRATICVPSAG